MFSFQSKLKFNKLNFKKIFFTIIFLFILGVSLTYLVIRFICQEYYYKIHAIDICNNINYDSSLFKPIKIFKSHYYKGPKEIDIVFFFKLKEFKENQVIFQTAPDNLGLTLFLRGANLILLINSVEGTKEFKLKANIKKNKDYKLTIKIDRRGHILVKINSNKILDKIEKFLDFQITEGTLGGIYSGDKVELFEGSIKNFNCVYKILKKRKFVRIFENNFIFLFLLFLCYTKFIFLNDSNFKSSVLIENRIDFWLNLIIVNLVIILYGLLFFNRYFSITDGLWSLVAKYILSGKMPYRDFYLPLTPLLPLKITGFIFFFGYDFIYLRILGLFLIVIMTTLLFLIFRKFMPSFISMIVTILAVVSYFSFNILTTYDYVMFGYIYMYVITLLFLEYLVIKEKERNKAMFTLFICSLMVSFLFLTKQNYGLLFITVFILMLCLIHKKDIKPLIVFSIGLFLPLLVFFLWLIKNRLLILFWQQVFLDAINSKGGSLGRIIFNWFNFLTEDLVDLLGILIAVYIIWKALPIQDIENDSWGGIGFPKKLLSYLLVFAICFFLILFPLHYKEICDVLNESWIGYFRRILPKMLFILSAIYCFKYLVLYLRLNKKNEEKYLSFFFISFAISLCGASSCGGEIFLYTVQLPMGFFIALMFKKFSTKTENFVRNIYLFIISCLIIINTNMKLNSPYSWFVYEAPSVKKAIFPANEIKYLKGFYLDRKTLDIFYQVNHIVQTYSKPTETIFSYPHMPVFYLMNERYPATLSFIHWFDFASDRICLEDSIRLKKNTPQVIIRWVDVDNRARSFHEKLYRGNKNSGQREIERVLDKFMSQPFLYKKEATFQLYNNFLVEVWRRNI